MQILAPRAKEPAQGAAFFPMLFTFGGSNGRRTAMSGKKEAISGTVTGNDQHVGFRAMIMKQAIEYNLAGFTKNLPNDVVSFVLQGDGKRLTDAVSAI